MAGSPKTCAALCAGDVLIAGALRRWGRRRYRRPTTLKTLRGNVSKTPQRGGSTSHGKSLRLGEPTYHLTGTKCPMA